MAEHGTYGERVITGHFLIKQAPATNRYHDSFNCGCGEWKLDYARLKQNGKIDLRCVRQWEGHLEGIQIPDDTFIEVGLVKMKHATKHIVIFTRKIKDIDKWYAGSRPWYVNSNTTWLIGVWTKKKTPTYQIKYCASTQASAMADALKLLRSSKDAGKEVEYLVKDGVVQSVPLTSLESVAGIISTVDEALAEGDLVKVQTLMAEVESFLNLVPIMETKAAELKALLYSRLTGVAS